MYSVQLHVLLYTVTLLNEFSVTLSPPTITRRGLRVPGAEDSFD